MSRTLEQIWWTNGVLRSSNEQPEKALEELTEYPDAEQRAIICAEAARRLRKARQEPPA